ncbi:phosphatidylserine decarboxylase-domain-containing protein, partial [Mycena polygramma]
NHTLTSHGSSPPSSQGLHVLDTEGRGKFENTYICPDPNQRGRGFKSWDAFFTREVQATARPVYVARDAITHDILPGDADFIVNACESTVFRIALNVKAHDRFWLKGQNYSLYDMLNGDALTPKKMEGGTVYQGFLSAFDYHRWRSPIAGKIVKTELVAGTYYAGLPDDEFNKVILRSQAWLTHSATRAIVHIESANPKIGLVVFIAVGMVEVRGNTTVSTCEVLVKENQEVAKGSELGMFHYGGSTHTLIFGPATALVFDSDIVVGKHIKVLFCTRDEGLGPHILIAASSALTRFPD